MNQQMRELRAEIAATVWAMQPEHLRSMVARVEMLAAGGTLADHALAAMKAEQEIQAARRQHISAATGGAVAVLPLYGVITQRSNWWSYYGGTTTESFTMQLRQAMANPNVTAIVIDVDSPGGSVAGVEELAAEIYAARSKKTIAAVSNTLNASAAYYLSSAASEVWASPSSLTGSIGVYQVHDQIAGYLEKLGVKVTLISAGKFKVEGNEYEALTEGALEAMQKMVSGYYGMFVKAVARGRGVKAADVTAGFGEGRVLMAADALAAGLVDKVGTLDALLAKFGVVRPVDDSAYAAGMVGAPAAAAEALAVSAALEDGEDSGDEDGDQTPGEGDDPCECECSQCKAAKCADCTVADCTADGCQCETAKGKRESKAVASLRQAVALERQRIAVALAL